MARKKQLKRVIDQKTTFTGAPLPLLQEEEAAPPAFYNIPAPDTLIEVGQTILRSTQAPTVAVAVSWQEAPNIAPDYYNVEWDEDIAFTNLQRKRANDTSATIDGLKANGVTYYFRVQAVMGGIYSEFSDTLTVVTITDDTPPPNVTGQAAVFQNSDLAITYTIPQSEKIKDVEIKIYNAGHTTLYGTFYTTSQRFVWTAEQNIYATGGLANALKSVSIDIRTRSWSNYFSLTTVNATATAPLPSTPTGYVSNWISDTGTASADFITSWLAADNAANYDITVDSIPYYTKDLRFVYRYDQNVSDHRPTLPSGKASFLWTLTAKDKLGQSSAPVSITVTNAAPPSGVMSLSVVGGFSTIAATVSLLSSTIVQDFDHYEWALVSGSTQIQTFNSVDTSVIFQLASSGTYIPTVRMVDKFNQKSATLSGSAVVLDTLTIDDLRSETVYSDWLGTAASTLAVLKDGVLYSSGTPVAYAANAGWQWVQATRPLLDRYKTITWSASWGTTLNFYFQVDTPNGTVYYSGPITISANGSYLMTRYTNQTTAQTNAYVFGTTAGDTKRFDFTQIEESRNIRFWFKQTSGTFNLYEYYPRRLVQSDDIEAESIRSINIAAAGINADRIFAVTLSAIQANIGGLVIDTSGYLWQGTGTAASPTTGLKIFNSSGIGKLSTYNSGVEQITLDTDGKFKWGAGNGLMDAGGIKIIQSTSIADLRSLQMTKANGTTVIGRYGGGYTAGASHGLFIEGSNVDSEGSFVDISAYAASGASQDAKIYIRAQRGTPAGKIEITSNGTYSTVDIAAPGTGGTVVIHADTYHTANVGVNSSLAPTRALSIFGDNEYLSFNNAAGTEKWTLGLNTGGGGIFRILDSTSGLTAMSIAPTTLAVVVSGDFAMNGFFQNILDDAATNATSNQSIVYHRTSGTAAAGFGSDFYIQLESASGTDRAAYLHRVSWATATDASRKARSEFHVFDTANRLAIRLEASGTAAMIGFLGANAVVRQNITGVMTGATLAQLTTVVKNLLTGLGNLGLITDSTT